MKRVNLAQKLASFNDLWSPKIVAELNGQYVKLAKLKGEFTWHQHEQEDELFLVLKGNLTIQLEDGELKLGEGELAVIPSGIRHRPVSEQVCEVLLFEPRSTRNTGDVHNGFTVESPEWI
jgi:mannose-6-phosphate isomerase-like protein (cupin superfamily)